MGTNPWEHSEGTCGHTANEDPSALVQLIKFPSLLAVSNIASPFWDLYIGLLPGPHQVKRRGERPVQLVLPKVGETFLSTHPRGRVKRYSCLSGDLRV